jgi:hypothetical protein
MNIRDEESSILFPYYAIFFFKIQDSFSLQIYLHLRQERKNKGKFEVFLGSFLEAVH